MPTHVISFEVPRADTIEFPSDRLTDGRYEFTVGGGQSVEIRGNREGLLYLAEVLVRFALGGYGDGFHAHLPLNSEAGGPNIDSSPELTIFAANESPGP